MFAFRLALALRMTVKRLLLEIDEQEMREWQIYYEHHPFGDEWLQTGMICSTTANVWGNETKPIEFMPIDYEKTVEEEMWEFDAACMSAGIKIRDEQEDDWL